MVEVISGNKFGVYLSISMIQTLKYRRLGFSPGENIPKFYSDPSNGFA